MNRCASCGKQLHENRNHSNEYCNNCLDQNGILGSYETVASRLAKDFVETQGIDEVVALDAAKEVLKRQPAWEPLFKKEMGEQRKKRGFQIAIIVLITIVVTAGAALGFYLHFRHALLIDDMFGIVKVVERNVGNYKIFDIDTKNCLINPVLSEGKQELIFKDKTFENTVILDLNSKKALSLGYVKNVNSQIKTKQNKYVFSRNELPYPYFRRYENKSSKIIMIMHDYPLYTALLLTNTPEESAREFNPILSDKFVAWTDGSKYLDNKWDIRAFNFETKKEVDIAVGKYNQVDPFFCGNKLFWYDYGNPEKPGFEIHGVDFDKNEKIKIPIGDGETITHTKNDRYVCWIGKNLKNAYIYDTIENRKNQFWDGYFNQYHEYEQFMIDISYLDEFSHQEWAGIFVSDGNDDNPIIAWETISKNSNGKFVNIAYKKLNDPNDSINYVIPVDSINRNLNLDGIMLHNLVFHTMNTFKYRKNIFINDQDTSKTITNNSDKNKLYIYNIGNKQTKLIDEQAIINQVSTNNKYIAWSHSNGCESSMSISYLELIP